MNKLLQKLLFALFFIILPANMFAQSSYTPGKERGDPAKRTKGQMEGNNIRTTIFNHGQTGRYNGDYPINVQTPYEWPKNTGKVYLALTGIFIGGEVVDEQGKTQNIVDVMNYRTSPQGNSWNIEPVPGYYNEANTSSNKLANSIDKDTWPAFWPDRMSDDSDPGWAGAWNGYFGKDKFNADQEMFYRASDDRYSRYSYYFPDSTDRNRKGLGMLLDVRILAWSQVLVQDAMYMLHNIKNDGTKNIDKVAVTLWYADFVGGSGDSDDDISEFDLIEDIAWSRDKDHRAPSFGNDPVGIVAVTFLETPGNALDRIDNDGDGETDGPKVTEDMLSGEIADNLKDDNGNGLIDENQTHIPFGIQEGVTYADYIDQNGNAEEGSPVVTEAMVNLAATDVWKRWPVNPATDNIQKGKVHLVMVESDDVGHAFRDNIDNNGNGEDDSPVVTQAMVTAAASDAPYYRYKVPGSNVILYDVKSEDIGKKYADGIDNDGNGAVDEYMDEGIDEMIDEARDDGIDNDGDWDPNSDDVGLDGVAQTGDKGENDGKPTSGAPYGLPGEPNVDVTDVSETDQIGITNADYVPAGGLNIDSDAQMWFDFMIPGKFYDPAEVVPGEYDLFVSSATFPLRSGQTEPISLAVLFANGPVPDPEGQFRKQEILRKRLTAQETYNNDYQFANAPIIPTLTAVAKDNKVVLYWDDVAESSFDAYIDAIGGTGKDFEGYKIYRASDPAFEDALNITTGYGILKFKTPIAQYDKIDGISGFDPIGVDGVHFNLGDDTGLLHSFIDTTVQNGYRYYYAITSYDFGYAAGNITPSECPINIALQGDGSVKLGKNVAVVTPEAPSAGYVDANLSTIQLKKGTTTGQIGFEVMDEFSIKNGHVYNITFEDTIKAASTPTKSDTLTTKSYSLIDSTSNEILIDRNTHLQTDDEQPIVHGFRLKFYNEERVEVNSALSKWNDESITPFVFEKLNSPPNIRGEERPNDYKIIFGPDGFGTSVPVTLSGTVFPSQSVNFKVFNITTQKFINFGFVEIDKTGGAGKLTVGGALRDRIAFLEPDQNGNEVFTWWFYLAAQPDETNNLRYPTDGDTATIYLKKPFLSTDKFRFVASESTIDKNKASVELEKIKVVPNPYVATAEWEIKNPYNSGRGPRSLHFTHLPNKCTIRIFTINGELVDVIEHESALNDGTADWDMLSKDNLSISYGVYIYHVSAPEIGEKIGKFAVIK